ncbi:ligand-binding sensor domain-containing protein [Arcticibacter tournemirensis]|uniref:histidine kinase n=1 Tax=Arcticibacter tournemirensis TaxID=699437 RepID=A0A5M9HHF1_9SPHI|nr:hybrid sensor histidine kinase/response regulator transcription factor [Arcticibacter tournemirensis]KAA8484951.1 response regulator [Arcticibacter tournemirensis]TQM50608.1 ligand-binding sensor domain-containing protein [Arcticibacter tournemirensis]
MKFRCLGLFLIILFCSVTAFSQTNNTRFVRIGFDEGLSQSTVRHVFQDSKGFLWFGTRDGLNKYDGYKFVVYKKDLENGNSLSSNDIKAITEDRDGKLWIATWEGGVNVFDPKSGNFRHFRKRKSGAGGISSDFVECISIDGDNNVWMGNDSEGLDLYDRREQRFTHFASSKHDVHSLSSNNITSIYEDSQGTIWVGTTNGLNLYTKKNRRFKRFMHEPGNALSLSNNKIKFVFEDRKKNLWIGTYGGGLNLFDRQTQTFRRIALGPRTSDYNVLLAIAEDNNGNLWIGTENKGLVVFNPSRNSCIYFPNNDNDNTSISSRTINSVIKDIKGNIWIGTLNGGVNFVSTDAGKFSHYRHQEGTNSLSNNIVDCIYEDSKGYLWIGTDGGGVDRFDRRNRRFTNYRHIPNNANSIAGDYIPSVSEDARHSMWIGTWGEGMTVFDPVKNRYKHYRHNPSQAGSLSNNYVFYIYKDSRNQMWVGTYGGGLNRYDFSKDAFIHYQNDLRSRFSLSNNYILTISEDSKGNLLIGTDGGGLNIMNPATGRFKVYKHVDGVNSLSNNSVNSIWEDKKGFIWLGTNYGLNRLNPATGAVKSYFTKDGLSNDIVTALQGDSHGRLWISTADGFSRLNMENGAFKTFTIADGLQGNEFKAARCFSGNGLMYFGGTRGFNEFNPANIKEYPYDPPLLFTGFQVFNKDVPIGEKGANGVSVSENINTVKQIVLSYKQSVVTFEFASLNYADKQKKQYAYKLGGFDKQWHYIGTKNNITYTNLDPGEYLLEIKTLTSDGKWSDRKASLRLVITPPFWKTWWFRSLFVLGVGAIVLLVFYQRLSSIRQRNRQLETEVSKRTLQLKEINSDLLRSNEKIKHQNEKLEEYNREIMQKSDKILRQQEHIVYQNHELEKTVLELEMSNNTKDRFFSILAHDLKNPVAALSGISDLLKQKLPKLTEQEVYAYVNDINKSSSSVYNLLINLLDWARTQNKTITRKPSDVNVYELVVNAYSLMEQQMKSKSIRFTTHIDPAHTIYADRQMIDTAVRNIIGNSIKFTAAYGEIKVDSSEQHNAILLTFKDTGVGMTSGQISRLFDIKNQDLSVGTAGEKGTGLGLVVTKEFIEANEGSIEVESCEGQGTTFIISLPKASWPVEAHLDKVPAEGGPGLVATANEPTDMSGAEINGRKVLVVDDNSEIRAYLRLLLSDSFEVCEAANGEEGIRIATTTQPDVIISDMLMPVMNGLQLCSSIKGSPSTSHIPVILLTSQTNEESQLSGYEAGADAYLPKPVNRNILMTVICNFIRTREKIRIRFAQSDDIYPKDLPFSTLDREFLDKIVNYVEEHLSEPDLDHRKICELTSMSRTVLYAKFKSLTGQGVHDFIKSIRLKKALKLLQEGKLNINQVSYEVGFNTPSYFSKSFIKQYGVTPKEYVLNLRSAVKP